ncbi:Lrp/AsnC family transcriptional regulator [Streptomyces sp. NA02950]|uniref:Lrp/AsnC family transcriptional regulator n=1 Tax=Streptomyces sp. NA02950 TaxID=2742137 RepID=UPI001590BDBD|nr:Lrp/AsnC family transcriptional regulator [Streptomyces sp. NA02950]QKV97086.1 Lrp/AsnC family transcriptional regulator [Streptomyces sp. NA02950]
MAEAPRKLDQLDVLLIKALAENPRTGFLELSRVTGVSRATVQSRVQRLEASGVITGHGPNIDLPAAGYPVLAFVSLQIAQGDLAQIATELARIPDVLEAYGTTGASDVLCRVAATSHEGLQRTLLRINEIPAVVRSTSVMALSEVVAPRYLSLLEAVQRPRPTRVPKSSLDAPGNRSNDEREGRYSDT